MQPKNPSKESNYILFTTVAASLACESWEIQPTEVNVKFSYQDYRPVCNSRLTSTAAA
jgi:hypothetical protein